MKDLHFTHFPTLTGGRLALRQLSSRDQEDIFALRSDPEINKYLGRQQAKTIEDAKTFIDKVNDNFKNNASIYWAITLANSGAFVGTVCLFDISSENNSCEIGYELKRAYQGKGLMKDAIALVIDFAFQALACQEIVATTHRDNLKSNKLLTGFNFKKSLEPNKDNHHLDIFTLSNPDRHREI